MILCGPVVFPSFRPLSRAALAALLGLCGRAAVAGPEEIGPVVQQKLGISVRYTPTGGAEVLAIDPASPTRHLQRALDPGGQPFMLSVGDVITRVNGRPFADADSYTQALDLGEGVAKLRIIDGATRTVDDWVCRTNVVQERLKIGLNYLPGGGARVTLVEPGSPTLSLRRVGGPAGQPFVLLVGDVITRVNGVPILGVESYTRALNRSAETAVLTIIDRTTRIADDWVVRTTPATVPVPPADGVRDEPAMQLNLRSGRSNIRFTDFHAILIFDSNSHGIVAEDDKFLLNSVFSAFGLEFIRDSRAAGDFRLPEDFRIVSDYVLIQGDRVNSADILADVARVGRRVKQDDVVFLWAETEGAIRGGRRKLLLNGGADELDRTDLLERLRFRNPDGTQGTRLTILITDACSVSASPPRSSGDSGRGTSIWKSLYFGHRGTVDIASSGAGQKAFAVEGNSIFASAFRDAFDSLKTPKRVLDGDQDGFIDWRREFFPKLQAHTRERFEFPLMNSFDFTGNLRNPAVPDADILLDMRNQGAQTPVFLEGTDVTPLP